MGCIDRADYHLESRIWMLLHADEVAPHSKNQLAKRLKVDLNSDQDWKRFYEQSVIERLLVDEHTGNNPLVVNEKPREAPQVKFFSPI